MFLSAKSKAHDQELQTRYASTAELQNDLASSPQRSLSTLHPHPPALLSHQLHVLSKRLHTLAPGNSRFSDVQTRFGKGRVVWDFQVYMAAHWGYVGK